MFKIKENEIASIVSFLKQVRFVDIYDFMKDISSEYETSTDFFNSEEYADYIERDLRLTDIISKCYDKKVGLTKYGDDEFEGEVEISDEELIPLNSFIFMNFFDYIRKDYNVDNHFWALKILEVYERSEKYLNKIREKNRQAISEEI